MAQGQGMGHARGEQVSQIIPRRRRCCEWVSHVLTMQADGADREACRHESVPLEAAFVVVPARRYDLARRTTRGKI